MREEGEKGSMAQTDLASGSTCIHCIEESAERETTATCAPSLILLLFWTGTQFAGSHRRRRRISSEHHQMGKSPFLQRGMCVCVCWLLVASRNSTNRRVRLFSCLNSCCSYLCWRVCLCVFVVWLMDCSVVVVVVVLMGVCCLRIA